MSNTNIEGDLKVEHQNLDFKTGLMNLSGKATTIIPFSYLAFYPGNYTEDSLQRIAKSLVMTKLLKEKIVPQYKERYLQEFKAVLAIVDISQG